ncbi:hypothetical protein KC19_11G110400 [Ceratodon purpureus]|uniref:Choline transporter-like protein n=1 Tax=Ceratodon purpureus TaxID=3225 RepID=A0A8T0GG99_CERPU|nr:hypothetical protein KC19_11G110400 [Ceratodon purpureus]
MCKRVPDDIDGPPPPGFFGGGQWAPPTFGAGRDYHRSPPRGDYRGYPPSPDRRGRHSSIEDFIPAVFPRMDPPSYSDYGGPAPYGSEHYPRGQGDYAPDHFPRGDYPPDYGTRLLPQGYPPDYGHPDFDRRPPHDHGHPEFDRRGPLPPDVYPPPRHHPQGHEQAEVLRDGPRFDAGAGRPPLPYEPEPHHHHHPESPRREPPPVVAYPPREPSPPRGPPVESGGAHFPPMPYEPTGGGGGGGGGGGPPPPPAGDVHARVVEEEAPHFPPLPYEPEGPPAHHHGDGRDIADYPPEPRMDPRMDPRLDPRMDHRGDEGAVAYNPEMGMPPPFPDAHYGHATEHGHVKRKRFEGCKDYWAGFLFLFHFWAVVGVCIYLGVRGVLKTNQNNDLRRTYEFRAALSPTASVPTHLYSIKHWAPQLATAAASGWVFAFFWQWLVRTKTMIKVCLSLGAVSTGLLGIILVSTGTAKGLVGLIFLVAALFQGLYVHLVRHRIPFAAIMLDKTRGVVKRHKSLHLISMWTVFLAMFWLAIWIFGVSGAVSLPYGGWYAALLVLSLAWSMEVLRNIVYVTVAGVVGQYYYEGHHMPHFPVLRAYRHAWTISFGSVCLGSMFVAPVQGLHSMAKRLANEQGANEFLFSCVNCFLGVMEFFNRHFNKWAFVEVGLHGKSFVKSARQTWKMLKDQDAMLLINDDLTGAILLTSCIIGGVLTALVGGCWTFATHRYLTVGVSILSFIIGFFVTYLTLVVPESAVATYYVCFAEDPATLKKQDEPLYQYMAERKLELDQEVE